MNDPQDALPESVADLAGLGKLLDEHRPKLLAMVQRRLDPALGVRVDAEDILNDTFLAARNSGGCSRLREYLQAARPAKSTTGTRLF